MKIVDLLNEIKADKFYHNQITYTTEIPAEKPNYQWLKSPLHKALGDKLRGQGIKALYSHQAETIELVRQGKSTIVVTPTASGKTMCYNLPVIDHLLNYPQGRALYIFPTKALSQDQRQGINEYNLGIKAEIYDGDTLPEARMKIREESQIIITNPDMLHQGILPNHLKWHRFFQNLKYIVIDEIHYYRGVFGTQVGHLLRRLVRIAKSYGITPLFILCSATIENPKAHGERLTGVDLELVDKNGAPKGKQTFIFWQPPPMVSYLKEATWLLGKLVDLQVKTIAFSRARQVTERIVKGCRQLLLSSEGDNDSASRIMSYRGGYLPKERRQIEKALFSGEVHSVVSTNALELGIDVGHLDVCLIAGFPGTVASLRQQAGRAGRSGRESLVIFITVATPLDQYFSTHPQMLFAKPSEEALIDPENPYLLLEQLKCAAHEMPLSRDDLKMWGKAMTELVPILVEEGFLEKLDSQYYYLGQGYPAESINLRSCGGKTVQLREKGTNRLVGLVDTHKAINETYPGAVYLHQGETYLVTSLDLDQGIATIAKRPVEYYTMVKRDKETEVLAVLDEKIWQGMEVYYGQLRVTSRVKGFIKKHEQSGQVLGEETLELPEQVLETTGMWFALDSRREMMLKNHKYNLMGSLHAIEHGAIGLLPLIAMCDRNDVGGLSTNIHRATQKPTVFIHDGYPGGVGFSQQAYNKLEQLFKHTFQAISGCQCEDGCLNCIHSPKCSNFNQPLDKEGAVFLLKELLGGAANEFI